MTHRVRKTFAPSTAAALFATCGLACLAPPAVAQSCVESGTNGVVKNGAPFCIYEPADLDLAVSPTQILVSSNCGLVLYDRGQPPQEVSRTNLRNSLPAPGRDGFFDGASLEHSPDGHRIFDPRVHYDLFSDRFWITACEQDYDITTPPHYINYNFGRLHVAVSKTANPPSLAREHWHVYDTIDVRDPTHVGAVHWGHPDRVTINADAGFFYMASRDIPCFVAPYGNPPQIDPTPCISSGFIYQNYWQQDTVVYIFPKTPLLDGSYVPGPSFPVFGQRLDPMDGPYDRTTLDVMAATFEPDEAPQYTLAKDHHQYWSPWHAEPVEDALRIEAWVHAGGIQFTRHSFRLELPPAAWFWSADGIRPGISAVSGMFHQAVFRNGHLYGAITMRPGPTGTPPGTRTLVRWFKVAMNNWPAQAQPGPQLARWEDIDPDSTSENEAFDPSIAVNDLGDVCITFTVASGTTYPQIWRAAYPVNGPVSMYAVLPSTCVGHFSQDYTGTEPDPLDPCVFWGHSALADPTPCPNQTWRSRLLRYCICEPTDADYLPDGQYNAGDQAVFDALFLHQQQEADFIRDGILDALDRIGVESTLRSRPPE